VDIKDLILNNENSLPTLTDTLGSPTTGYGNAKPAGSPGITMENGSLPTITADAATYWKFGANAVISLIGMYYLASGKRQNDLQKMLIGGVLTLASFFLF
jgi:hypothetical protein